MNHDHNDTYESWVRNEALIHAPKVHLLPSVSSPDNNEIDNDDNKKERGLYSTDTIYPGELIMMIPSESLIDDNNLQSWSSDPKEEGKANEEEENKEEDELVDNVQRRRHRQRRRAQLHLAKDERTIARNIAAMRRMVEDNGEIWRRDDSMALFLLGCQKLLRLSVSKTDDDVGKTTTMTTTTMKDEVNDIDTIDATVIDDSEDNLSLPHITNDIVEAIPVSSPLFSTENANSHVNGNDEQPQQITLSFLPHISHLPPSFPTHPLYYTTNELRLIEGTNCHGYATRMRYQIQNDWMNLISYIREFSCCHHNADANEGDDELLLFLEESDVTLEAYAWALSIIFSRSSDFWGEVKEGGVAQQRRVIAPYFDMMNHDFESEVTHSMDGDGNIQVFNGPHSIPPHTEITLSYGHFSNEKFLLVYGFTIPNNPHDVLHLYAPLPPSDPLLSAKTRVLQTRCNVADPNDPHPLRKGERLPGSLMAALRLTGVMDAEELVRVVTAGSEEEDSGDGGCGCGVGMVDEGREREALEALGGAMEGMSRQLALNLITDENLGAASASALVSEAMHDDEERWGINGYKGGHHFHQINQENARRLCQSEYEILLHASEEVRERIEHLGE